MPEDKPLSQIFLEEVKDIRARFEQERSKWCWDEIEWPELEKTAEESIKQLQEVRNKYEGKIDWVKLSPESRLPSSLSNLALELAMYVGPRNMRPCLDYL